MTTSARFAEIRRVLANDGLLLISTPNRDEYLVENEFHKREYSFDEFDALLARALRRTPPALSAELAALRRFRRAGVAAADEDSRPIELDLVKVAGVEPSRALYSVVICGPGIEEPRPSACPHQSLRGEPSEPRARGDGRAPRCVGRARADCRDLRDVYEKRGDAWQERATIAERRQEAWEARTPKVGELNDAIRKIESSFSWRLTQPLRAAKDFFVADAGRAFEDEDVLTPFVPAGGILDDRHCGQTWLAATRGLES